MPRIRLDQSHANQRPHFEFPTDDPPPFQVGSPFDGIRGQCDECEQLSTDLRNRSGSLLCPGCDQADELAEAQEGRAGVYVAVFVAGALFGGLIVLALVG